MSRLFAELAARYRAGATPAEVVASTYDRIAAHNDPALFIHLLPHEQAQAYARALRGRDPATLPLFGVPFVIKDNIDLAGVPTTAGCPAFAYTPTVNAPAVERLIAAGAIPIGKTNLDQFATGLVGVRSPYGVPRNALIPTIIPGGSSSGSGCAVAAGLVPFALGTDTAGSGRVPAAMGNIVGLKPTCGLVSTRGVVPAVRSLDCVSVFASCVADAKTVLDIIGGFDAADPLSRRAQPARPVAKPGSAEHQLGIDVKPDAKPSWCSALPGGTRVGIPSDMVLATCVPAVRDAFTTACNSLRTLGCSIVEIDYTPFAEAAASLYGGAWVAERTAAVGDFIAAHPDECHPVVRDIILSGRTATAVTTHRDRYRLLELRRAAEAAWALCDALMLPTVPEYPTVNAVLADPVKLNSRLGTFTNFANLFDTAALSVPVGTMADGLAASVTLFAPAWSDAFLADLGAALHARTGHGLGNDRAALVPAARPPSGWGVALAVVGAHLTGQPLNRQLTDHGAQLEETTRTAAKYRLYHLPTTPPKPGMVRVAEGGGHIQVEVWRLDETAFGRFVTSIPMPLGIGRIELEDGRVVNGFVCEPYGVAGCTDITAHGGWRAFRTASGV